MFAEKKEVVFVCVERGGVMPKRQDVFFIIYKHNTGSLPHIRANRSLFPELLLNHGIPIRTTP